MAALLSQGLRWRCLEQTAVFICGLLGMWGGNVLEYTRNNVIATTVPPTAKEYRRILERDLKLLTEKISSEYESSTNIDCLPVIPSCNGSEQHQPDVGVLKTLDVDWNLLGNVEGLSSRTGGRVFDHSNSMIFYCVFDKVIRFIQNTLNPEGGPQYKASQESADTDDLGFYRYAAAKGDATLFYPYARSCDNITKKAQPWYPRTVVGRRRQFVRVINSAQHWSEQLYYDGAIMDAGRQIRKGLLHMLDSYLEDDELAIGWFPPHDRTAKEIYIDDFSFVNKSWTLFPPPEEGTHFLKMTASNKQRFRDFINMYHDKFEETKGFSKAWPQQRSFNIAKRNFTYRTNIESIVYLFKNRSADDPVCHQSILAIDCSDVATVTQSTKPGHNVALMSDNTNYEILQVLHLLVENNITKSVIQPTYLKKKEWSRYVGEEMDIALSKKVFVHKTSRSDINTVIATTTWNDYIKELNYYTCGTSGQYFVDPWLDGWNNSLYWIYDFIASLHHQNRTVYFDHVDPLTQRQTIMGCIPGYGPRGGFLGVGCLDMSKYIRYGKFKLLPDFETEWKSMKAAGTTGQCPVPKPLTTNFVTFEDFYAFVDTQLKHFHPRPQICDIGSLIEDTVISKMWSVLDPSYWTIKSASISNVMSRMSWTTVLSLAIVDTIVAQLLF